MDLDESWVKLLQRQDLWREIATYDGQMRRIALAIAGLLAIGAVSNGPAGATVSAASEPVAYKYAPAAIPKASPVSTSQTLLLGKHKGLAKLLEE